MISLTLITIAQKTFVLNHIHKSRMSFVQSYWLRIKGVLDHIYHIIIQIHRVFHSSLYFMNTLELALSLLQCTIRLDCSLPYNETFLAYVGQYENEEVLLPCNSHSYKHNVKRLFKNFWKIRSLMIQAYVMIWIFSWMNTTLYQLFIWPSTQYRKHYKRL